MRYICPILHYLLLPQFVLFFASYVNIELGSASVHFRVLVSSDAYIC